MCSKRRAGESKSDHALHRSWYRHLHIERCAVGYGNWIGYEQRFNAVVYWIHVRGLESFYPEFGWKLSDECIMYVAVTASHENASVREEICG